jgi:hypothetical protein
MSWFGRFFLKQAEAKVEEEKAEDDGILKGEIIGGTITPVITPVEHISTHILSASKLNNRLRIITGQIAKLERLKADAEMIAHWKERKEKVKAQLWIYFDENN